MLLNRHKKQWTDGLKTECYDEHSKNNEETVENLLRLFNDYSRWRKDEETLSKEEAAIPFDLS
jgi:26S proteasome regulatory subunit N11